MTRYETYRRMIECCTGKHKTIEELYSAVNYNMRGKNRQSVTAVSARRRDPIVKDLFQTCTSPGRGQVGFYIAEPTAMDKLNERFRVRKAV